MDQQQHQIICHHCDLLLSVPDVEANEQAICPRCRTTLANGRPQRNLTCQSMLLTALILLIVSLFQPFLSFETNFLENEISLYRGMQNILYYDEPFFGVIVSVFVVFHPLLILLSLLFFLSTYGQRLLCEQSARNFFRYMLKGSKWIAVEVFVLGVLVSLTKIQSLADVKLGLGFYLYCLFVIVFNFSMSRFNTRLLWLTAGGLVR